MEIFEAAGWIALGFIPTFLILLKGGNIIGRKISSNLTVGRGANVGVANDNTK